MTQRTGIFYDIITEYNDKGAKAADKSLSALGSTAKKVAGAFGLAFGAVAIANYGKNALQAFNQDNIAAKSLTQTLTNLGLAFDDNRVKLFIADMEKTYKVLDDQLRPAMQSLLQVTGSVAKSQGILKSALNLSAGTNTDLATAVQALSQAYVGNLKGLKQFNLGLTQAELKGKSFDQVLALIDSKFQSQALLKAADPFKAIGVAAENAKETIGQGLVNAMANFSNSGDGVKVITGYIETMSKATATLVENLGKVGGFFAYGIKGLADSAKATKELFTGASNVQISKGQYPRGGGQAIDTAASARKKAEDAAIARNKELLKLATAQTTQQKEQLALAKQKAILDKASTIGQIASPIFDIQSIEIYAAMQQATNEGDRARLQLMKDLADLQKAIANNDSTLAVQIASSVQQDVKNLAILQGGLNGLKSPDNPLKSFLDDIAKAMAALDQLTQKFQLSPLAAFAAKVAVQPDYPLYASPWQFGGASADVVTGTVNPLNNQITINVAGTVVTEQQLSNSLANLNASGIASNISRLNVNYGTP